MAGATIGNSKLQYINYLRGVDRTLNAAVKMRNWSAKDDRWTGDRREWRVHVSRNGAIQYTEDGGKFPEAGNQSHVPAFAYRKFLQGKIQITDGAMATIKSDANAAKGIVESEVRGMMEDMKKYESFMSFRDGTGVVAELTDASLASSALAVPVTDGRFLRAFKDSAMVFEVYDSSLSTLKGKVGVVLVQNSTNAAGRALVNFTGTVTGAAAGDKIVPMNALNRAVTGLLALVDDSPSSFQGVDVSLYPEYSALVQSNGGDLRALTPHLFRKTMAGLIEKTGNDNAGNGLKVIGTPRMLVNMEELYEGELRLEPSTKTGGFVISSFQSALGRVDLSTDTDCPYNTLFMVDFSKIFRGVQKELSWRNSDADSGIFKRSDQAAKYEATAIEICDYYIRERFSSARIDDLREDRDIAY